MAINYTLIRTPDEKASQFNARLKDACSSEADPITDFQLDVVDGLPVVTLISEMEEADEEDVEAAKEAGDTLELGAEIPAGPALIVQVGRLMADTAKNATESAERIEKLLGSFGGDVLKQLVAKGTQQVITTVFDKDGKDSGLRFPIAQEVAYTAIGLNAEAPAAQKQDD